ncbi:MAG: hypothetical protein JJV95_03355 [Sulfurospirillum sp.]|nr:hypothetical protein [Sulfurospirillum sp.]
MKREFLIEEQKDLYIYLQTKSLASKLYKYENRDSYVYEFEKYTYVLERYEEFNKLVLIGKKNMVLNDIIGNLKEITNDIRYTKEYLALFGNPKNYEFDEKEIFKKCDNDELEELNLFLKNGMNSAKVFRVILYKLNKNFTLKYEQYTKLEIKYIVLEKIHKKIMEVLKYSKNIFDQQIIDKITEDFENLHLLLDNREIFEKYTLNFQIFIHEESFYNKDDANKPIYFFKNRANLFRLAEDKNEKFNK